MVDEEVWLPVTGFEGFYSVSNLGRVRSEARVVPGRWGPKRVRERILVLTPRNKVGHLGVALHREGEQVSAWVHRLVLVTFEGPPPKGMECLHRDGDPTNNRLDNLRWGYRSENVQDALRHGRNHNASKTHCKRGHLLSGRNLRVLSKGQRSCIACELARGRSPYRSGSLEELADEAYKELQGSSF